MPIQECSENSLPGFKWGDSGKCYVYHPGNEAELNEAKRRAYVQGYAIEGGDVSKILSSSMTPDDKVEILKAMETEKTIMGVIESLIGDEKEAIDAYTKAIQDFPQLEGHLTSYLEDERKHLAGLQDLKGSKTELAIDVRDVHVDRPIGEKCFESDDSGTIVSKSIYVPISKVDTYQHKVFGIVLQPNEVDLQGDIIPPEEIEKASDVYMEHYRNIWKQHESPTDAVVIQNYIAPIDFMLGSEKVRKGAWIMGIKINDPAVWQDVVEGKLTGLSIGGYAKSTPL